MSPVHPSLQFKNMEFSYAIDRMFNQILPNLQHGNDGLIFTAVNAEYKFGTDDKMYDKASNVLGSVRTQLTGLLRTD